MKRQTQGFTLAELLIVVAIIAVLVSISIPIFTTLQERARESTDLANVRGAYTEVLQYVISEDKAPTGNVTYAGGVWKTTVSLTQKKAGWQSKVPITVGGITSGATGGSNSTGTWLGIPTATGTCTITCKEDGSQTLAWDMNFTEVLLYTVVTDTGISASYRGRSIDSLLSSGDFPMIDSSGPTGRYFSESIKQTLGLSGSSEFAYTIIKGASSGVYNIYISTEATLKNSGSSGGRTIPVIGYVYDANLHEILQVGPEMRITTYANSGREKMNYEEYSFE